MGRNYLTAIPTTFRNIKTFDATYRDKFVSFYQYISHSIQQTISNFHSKKIQFELNFFNCSELVRLMDGNLFFKNCSQEDQRSLPNISILLNITQHNSKQFCRMQRGWCMHKLSCLQKHWNQQRLPDSVWQNTLPQWRVLLLLYPEVSKLQILQDRRIGVRGVHTSIWLE